MYERKAQPLLSRRRFARRLLGHAAVAVALLAVSLAIGIWGYAAFERLPAIDGFLNAAMLLGGMGPVNNPVSFAGKLFAGLYALYAGLVFIAMLALILTPIMHRVLHHFHWTDKT
jgi:hypothetical protein